MVDTPTETKKGAFFGTPFVILSFVLVFMVLFDYPRGVRDGTAWLAGFLLQPVIGFGGAYPLATIFLASVVLVIATTAIRHFLTDWTKMARMQEAMREFSKEMKDARKSNNTYKLKKLTEAQADLMQLQSSAQMDQMKPMALTMLLVIPIFAWLGAFLAVPVIFDADSPPSGTYAIAEIESDLLIHAAVLGPGAGSFSANDGADAYALRLEGTPEDGALRFDATRGGRGTSIPIEGAPALPTASRIGAFAAGNHTFRIQHEAAPLVAVDANGSHLVGRVLLVLDSGAGWQAFAIGTDPTTLSTAAVDAYVVILWPAETASVSGGAAFQVVDGNSFDAGLVAQTFPLTEANLVALPQPAALVLPIDVRAPWTHAWDVMDPYKWFTGGDGWFPRWIVLYSLFGIPFGQIAQRALKLWEYRHVDLDADGIPAGKSD